MRAFTPQTFPMLPEHDYWSNFHSCVRSQSTPTEWSDWNINNVLPVPNFGAVFSYYRLLFSHSGTELSLCLLSISLLKVLARYGIRKFFILICYSIKVVLKPHQSILNLFQFSIKKICCCNCQNPVHYSVYSISYEDFEKRYIGETKW